RAVPEKGRRLHLSQGAVPKPIARPGQDRAGRSSTPETCCSWQQARRYHSARADVTVRRLTSVGIAGARPPCIRGERSPLLPAKPPYAGDDAMKLLLEGRVSSDSP